VEGGGKALFKLKVDFSHDLKLVKRDIRIQRGPQADRKVWNFGQ